MTKYLIKHLKAGKAGEVVHFGGPLVGDMALCGHDISGDATLGWSEGTITNRRVNCPQCITVAKYVLTNIKLKDLD